MKWNNLKNNKCPNCNSALLFSHEIITHWKCSKCSFQISNERFESLVDKLYHPQKLIDSRNQDIQNNLSALNNMGHDVVKEDFSDSPFADREELLSSCCSAPIINQDLCGKCREHC